MFKCIKFIWKERLNLVVFCYEDLSFMEFFSFENRKVGINNIFNDVNILGNKLIYKLFLWLKGIVFILGGKFNM